MFRLLCVLVQTFVRSPGKKNYILWCSASPWRWRNQRVFEKCLIFFSQQVFPIEQHLAVIRFGLASVKFFCSFMSRSACAHVQTFVRSIVYPGRVILNTRRPHRAFIFVWTYPASVWDYNLGNCCKTQFFLKYG